MRMISKKILAIGLAVILLAPGLSVLAEETTETGDVSGVEISQTVSGSDINTEIENVDDQIMPLADGDIASGTDGNITWVIDANGKLTVSGSGNLSGDMLWGNSAWGPYREQILSAEINVSGMTDASHLFYGCKNMKSLNVTNFDTHNATTMTGMFRDCSALTDLNLSNFETSNVRDMSDMFSGCSNLITLDVSRFNTENVTDMHNMFRNCSNLTRLNISNFNTGKVTNMEWMFADCSNLINLDIGGFDTGNVHFMRGMFYNCSNLASLDVSGFNTENVWFMGWMLYGCSSLVSLDVSGFDTSNVTDMRAMFLGCSSLTNLDVSGFDTSNVTDMRAMFEDCNSLTNLDVSGFDTSNVTDMGVMFDGCNSITNLDVSGFDTSNVTDMSGMFLGCSSLTNLDVSGFNTSNVTDMSWMFEGCSSIINLDVSGFDTSSVTDMCLMFLKCSSMTNLDVSGFDTSNVTDIHWMFFECSSLTNLDVSGFDTGNVTCMSGMFFECSSLTNLDMSGFDTSNVTDMSEVLSGCNSLTTVHSPRNVAVIATLPCVLGTTWHLPDGTEVTELPQGLDYSVTLTRSGTPITPQITTTTLDLNMADVVRVKYVPYSYTVETNNIDPDNTVTFSIEEGRLADGLELYPATGEIYGVPLETGSFPITVKATYSNPAYLPSYAELTLTVLDNTDANVGIATDFGYDITQPVTGFNAETVDGNGTQTLVSQGEYAQFRDVYIDGIKLTAGRDYTSESGSTRITILNQTLSSVGEGTHTLGIEFRTEDGILKRAAQNYVIGKSSGGNGNTGDHSGANAGDKGDGNGTNSNTDSLTAADSTDTLQYDFIFYTVEKGDSLWKIASKFYGHGSSWRRIYEDNKLVIKDPSRLYKGQQLIIRLTNTAGCAPDFTVSLPGSGALEGTVYRVQAGDRLWTIARRAYGSGKLWTLIYEANRDSIANPERIRVGQAINIPQR